MEFLRDHSDTATNPSRSCHQHSDAHQFPLPTWPDALAQRPRKKSSVSVSVAAEQTLSALLDYSNVALHHAKAAGRNRVKRADQPKPDGKAPAVIRVA